MYFCIMETRIPYLIPGDTIALVAPAKAIEAALVDEAKLFFENHGFRVQIGVHCKGEFHYFSGTDWERASDFQSAIEDPEVKAIVCVRGGYGCIRIVDMINWAGMLRFPKWIIGFSDVTVFHQRMQRYQLPSIHATMPLNFQSNSEEALASMLDALQGNTLEYSFPSDLTNKLGRAKGNLIGGNLSILYSLIGTDEQPNYQDCVLFIEDLAEQLYHIDRMFYALAKAGILDRISGLIVGGMTDMKDTATPFGQSLETIVLNHFTLRNIPIAFGFPAGHIDDNRALIFGTDVEFEVSESEVILRIFAK